MAADALRTRRWWVLAGLLAVALVVWLWRSSDRARIAAVLDDVSAALTTDSAAVRGPRVTRTFARAFAADARASAPDLAAPGVGPEALATIADRVMRGFAATRVQLGHPSIEVAASGREANAQLQIVASGSAPDVGTVTDVREARVELRKTDAGWRIVSVALSARSRDEPEARP